MIKNYLTALFTLFGLFCAAQVFEIPADGNHYVSYSIENDSLRLRIEVLNDFSVDLDDDNNLDQNDDFAYIFVDFNVNDAIDIGSQIDKYFLFDSAQQNNLCEGRIVSPANITNCLPNASGVARVDLLATVQQTTPHLVYDFIIATSAFEFNQSLCARLSMRIHTGGTPLASAVTFPEDLSGDEFFVTPYNNVNLYTKPEIKFGNQVIPSGEVVNVCVGDTLLVNTIYPYYSWNAGSEEFFQIANNLFTSFYSFTLVDGADSDCLLSDTVFVKLLDASLCAAAYNFPNVVTPNNDGFNDFFEPIIGRSVLDQDWTGSELKIYNRWGVRIYKSPAGGYPIWDLRSENGDIVTAGTYFYTFKAPSVGESIVNGFFTVVYNE